MVDRAGRRLALLHLVRRKDDRVGKRSLDGVRRGARLRRFLLAVVVFAASGLLTAILIQILTDTVFR